MTKLVDIDINKNLEHIKTAFSADKNSDVIIREFLSGGGKRLFLLYIDGMASTNKINDFIMRPVMQFKGCITDLGEIVEYNNCTKTNDLDAVIESVLDGDTAVFADGTNEAIICETKEFDKRSVSQPTTEVVVKGSQEAFNESLRSNVTLIRRSVKSPYLVTEIISVGDISAEKCAVLYLDNIADEKTVNEVKRRLKMIEGDFISGSGMVEQMIEDSKYSLFPTVLSTERPNRAAQHLASGRVVIVCDNTPFALVVPITMSVLLDSPEGNGQRWQDGTYTRVIRSFAFFCTTLLSGLYIALVIHHQDMIPYQLIDLLIETRIKIPFSAFTELIVMEVFFDLVREAGLRVPNAMGNAIGIVGGLILGSAAVDANIVSPVTLIIVAISGLANAAIPDYDLAVGIRIIKFFFILFGALFGFIGLGFAIVLTLIWLSGEESFGVNMLDTSTGKQASLGNAVYQKPLWKQELRPSYLAVKRRRQQPDISRKWEEENSDDKR